VSVERIVTPRGSALVTVRRLALAALTTVRLALPYVGFSLLKRVVPATRLARWAWQAAAVNSASRQQRAIAAVTRLRRTFGADRGDCLEAALVLYRELSRAGADPRLVMGFRREDAQTAGHAWVEVDGAIVGETRASPPFVPTVVFGPHGRRVA
jgi:hypothetical protein